MNLHSIASSAISSVNPMIKSQLRAATDYTTQDDGTQVETYSAPVTQMIQVQSLSTDDLAQVDAMNIQKNLRKVWMNGRWDGVVRSKGKGGDILTFFNQTWYIVQVLERWPDWTSVVVALQDAPTTQSR